MKSLISLIAAAALGAAAVTAGAADTAAPAQGGKHALVKKVSHKRAPKSADKMAAKKTAGSAKEGTSK